MKNYNRFLRLVEKEIRLFNREVVIIGIGNSRIIGDSFGPLVGEMLKSDFNVVGDMKENVNYNNFEECIENINRKYENPYIITVDSALSNILKVGEIFASRNVLELGKGLEKSKKSYNNVSIKGVVSIDYKDSIKNFMELKNVSIDIIEKLAYVTSYGIKKILK